MKYSIIIENLIISIGLIFIGFKLTYDGWMILRHKRIILYISEKLGLYLVRRFQGESAASLYLEKNSRPRKIMLRGIDVLITGVAFLIAGLFFLLKGSIMYKPYP